MATRPAYAIAAAAPSCSGNHKLRLFVGEGDFTYTEGVLAKHQERHPNLGKSFVATELRETIDCNDCDTFQFLEEALKCEKCTKTAVRIRELLQKGVKILYKVDASKLHEHPCLQDKHFSRIHWNIPHDGSSRPTETMPDLIKSFFASCKKIQNPGDRVYISIPQPPGKEAWYQAGVYNLASNAAVSGFVLASKRVFGTERYPKYKHLETARNASNRVAAVAREFGFKLLSRNERSSLFDPNTHKTTTGKCLVGSQKFTDKQHEILSTRVGDQNRACYGCETDQDSSDYSDGEEAVEALTAGIRGLHTGEQ